MAIDLTSNCLFHFKMNDNAANKTVVDTLGQVDGEAQRNTSILSSPGKINQSLRNDDTIPDYIKVAEGVVGTVSFAVLVWVKLLDYNQHGVIASYRETSSNVGIWLIFLTNENKVTFCDYRGGYGILLTTNEPIPNDGLWHQVLCQRIEQAAGEDGHIWIDNGNVDYVYQTGKPKKSLEPFYHTNFGSSYAGNNPIDGYLDCCAVWKDRVIIEGERNFLWNNGLGTENMKSCVRPLSGGSLAGKRGLT